ncbi:DNA mismatch repair protein MutT [Bacillus cereus]|uniref:NUDIX domain-containing protein n=1 Tax=Bacillus sp. AFS023182 TaxID=2033492 RepID=UPI000BF68BAC|nr:NUDIX domain-containing protein [Bacillus sp. AFS023182]PFD96925.1 DNA mismatch repair protein MutT [Bacillus sp. AFS023182]PGY04978.1 DNA mismatch repair protein MutT [Bacillus cereus]
MDRPKLRAEGIISNADRTKFLVQCDLEESFYRLPGGSIEFGESASDSIVRELLEEYDLQVNVGELVCINETVFEYNGKTNHHCTLIHRSFVHMTENKEIFIHKELPKEVKLVWRTTDQLQQKPISPEGILDIMTSKTDRIAHISV